MSTGSGIEIALRTGSTVGSSTQEGIASQSLSSSESKWGFLKNIVNIDSFFSSAATSGSNRGSNFHGRGSHHMNMMSADANKR